MVSYASIGYYDKADSQIQSIPLDFIRNGDYYHADGRVDNRSYYGLYWRPDSDSDTNSKNLTFYSTRLYPQSSNNKGLGMALRCLVR